MRRAWMVISAAVFALICFAVVWRAIAAQAGEARELDFQEDTMNTPAPHREADGNPSAPAISFIDGPGPTCYQARRGSNVCYVTWTSLSVTAGSGQYVISMTVTLGNRLRAFHAGFFQTSMYVPGDLYGAGFRVPCGLRSEGPSPNLGRTYSYEVRARETGGLGSTNYGSVTCPADEMSIYLPLIHRP